MQTGQMPHIVKIVYFSGTGGTKKAAGLLASEMQKRNVSVILTELNGKKLPDSEKEDLLVVMYPVYAMNAPEPVMNYIHQLPTANQTPAAVLSVSGGGEISPNTACRVPLIRKLEQKGFSVFYETMLVMPSNSFSKMPDELSILLLKVLPVKIETIASEILNGVHVRTKPLLIDRVMTFVAKLEVFAGRWFGRHIQVESDCTGCERCAQHCPRGNITMQDRKPVFSNQCCFCLKCIYDCPQNSLKPGIIKFAVFPNGYDLDELEKQVDTLELDAERMQTLAKGYSLSGIRKYLLESDLNQKNE